MRAARAIALLVGAALLASCGGDGTAEDVSRSRATTTDAPGPAIGIVAIGHSGLTGESSDPARPGQSAFDNSWATGTSPEVRSIYTRIVEQRPEIEGHVANTAEGGAVASQLAGQLRRALETVPRPGLVIIQTLDNDIRCGAANADRVAESIGEALEEITAKAPEAQILVVGQMGRPDPAYISHLVEVVPEEKADLTWPDECTFFDRAGALNEAGFRALSETVDRYEAAQNRVCATFPTCHTDKGVRARYVDKMENFSPDWAHLNVKGQAEEAAITWPLVADILGLEG
jgi:hypothetical protein